MRKDKKYEDKIKEVYKVRNWSSYNKSLIGRGNVRIWLSDDVQKKWYYNEAQKPGGEVKYSDSAIEFCLTIKHLYGLGYRQTEGYIKSLFDLAKIDLQVPSYSQIQRRSKGLEVNIKVRKKAKGAIDLVVDSTGLKVYGEGEWKVRKHGYNKFRVWRLFHMGSDASDLEIMSVGLTENKSGDSKPGVKIINELDCTISSVAADGAYDTKEFRGAIPDDIPQLIPPRKDAALSKGKIPEYKQRDEAIELIKEVGRKKWKEQIGYHIRSKSEVNMYRYKMAFGEKLNARKFEFEKTEIRIKSKILNQFVELGMPESYRVT